MFEQRLTRLAAMADGWRGSNGNVALAAEDFSALGGDKAFKGAQPAPNGRSVTVAAEQLCKAVDTFVAEASKAKAQPAGGKKEQKTQSPQK